MDDMKNRILDCVGSVRGGATRSQIIEILKITGSKDFIKLDLALQQMENTYELFRRKGNVYRTREQMNLISGVLHMNKKGIGYVDEEDGMSIMIFPENLNSAMNGDEVLVKRGRLYEDYSGMPSNYIGSVITVLKRKHVTLVGTFVDGRYGPRFVLDDEKLQDRRISLLVPPQFHPTGGMKALARVTRYDDPLEMTMERELGYVDDPGVDILSVLLEHEIDPEFPEDVKKQVESVPTEVDRKDLEGRVDLTGDITVTIDGDDSKDFDDAVSVVQASDGWFLKVSIADVAHYVKEGTPLDNEAVKRGTSTYAVNSVVPMLPHELSNGICSLNPQVIRLTNTCEMHIAKDGSVRSYKVYSSYIRSTERMTYNNVNKILDGDKETMQKYAHLGNLFFDLRDCADAIRSERNRKGAIDFETNESVIICDEKGKAVDVRLRERGHAERMIEDCMIAANVCVANLMHERNIPALYRIHEIPSDKKLSQFVNTAYLFGTHFNMKEADSPKYLQEYLRSISEKDSYPILSKMLLRSMQKAKYDPKCIGHYGLAEEEYLHFTSPIRRYPDLVVHRMLEKYYYKGYRGSSTKDEQKMLELAESCSTNERNSADAEYDAMDMKKAEYMEDKIGQKFEGVITSVMSYGFFVELDNTVEGLVRLYSLRDDMYDYDAATMSVIGQHTHRTYQVGQKIVIRVVSVNVPQGQIDFDIPDANAKPRKPEKKYNTRSRASKKADQRGYGQERKPKHSSGREDKKSYSSDRKPKKTMNKRSGSNTNHRNDRRKSNTNGRKGKNQSRRG